MDDDIKEKYLQAGRIASQVREESRKWVFVGKSLLELAEQIESAIKEKGGEPAFPVNLSINDISAHYTPTKNDSSVIKEKDVIKVDIGVHVDGYIADTAYTVSFNDKYNYLVDAVKNALKEAIKMCTPGTTIAEISGKIEETIRSFGCNPVSNLTGHGLERFTEHTDPEIPNVKINSSYMLKEDQVIAIEPFATSGEGRVKDTETILIFMLSERKPVRNPDARKIIEFVERFNGLPFAERWIPLSLFKIRIALRELRQRGVIYDYPILKEVSNGVVAQYEHTVIVKDKPIIITE